MTFFFLGHPIFHVFLKDTLFTYFPFFSSFTLGRWWTHIPMSYSHQPNCASCCHNIEVWCWQRTICHWQPRTQILDLNGFCQIAIFLTSSSCLSFPIFLWVVQVVFTQNFCETIPIIQNFSYQIPIESSMYNWNIANRTYNMRNKTIQDNTIVHGSC